MSEEQSEYDKEGDLVAGVEVPDRLPGSLPLPATGRELAQFVALRAAACVGADYSNMALFDAVGQSLRLFHGTFLTPEMADRYTDVPLSAPFPIAAAARHGTSILLPDLASYGVQFPEDPHRHHRRRRPSHRIVAAASRGRHAGGFDRLR